MAIIIDGPVFPIPPSYDNNQKLDMTDISVYLDYLKNNNVNAIMTTAGTSQFNLLTKKEIREFNKLCSEYPKDVILGLPPLSLDKVKKEIELINTYARIDNSAIMLIYPDRYYDDDTIIDYFNAAASVSNIPIFIHGMPMRSGRGGYYDYLPELVCEIQKNHKIIGMKEECSTFEKGFELCSNISKDFMIVVAGKSQRRFSFLQPVGAKAFLTGIGSLFPKIDNIYFEHIMEGDYESALSIMTDIENRFFDVFMSIGWHKALREGLRQLHLCCFYDRQPFPKVNNAEKQAIKNILDYMESLPI